MNICFNVILYQRLMENISFFAPHNDPCYETLEDGTDFVESLKKLAIENGMKNVSSNYEYTPGGEFKAVNLEWHDGDKMNSILFFVKVGAVKGVVDDEE